MHGNRRRKKRPNYGVRTVEISKGPNGFGFTISGQAPCILSCIVQGSPAERAGLRPGDYLIAVNGQNVSKSPHDDVVKSIGLSKLLKLQIAENYYSDSSDEDFSASRPKPKYPNRLRHKQQTRVEKVVRDVQNGALFSDHSMAQLGDVSPTLEREWNEHVNAQLPSTSKNTSANIAPTPSPSPTRLRPDQIQAVMAEARKNTRNPRTSREEAPIHPPRVRCTPKKVKSKNQAQMKYQENLSQGEMSANEDQSQKFRPQHIYPYKTQFQDLSNHPHLQYSHHSFKHQLSNESTLNKPYAQQAMSSYAARNNELQHIYQQLNSSKSLNGSFRLPSPAPDGYKVITQQDINNILYPTLAELQQKITADHMGDLIYRSVVGYLGTIEMPKEPQEASRLTAIRNCIRRLRIEKKVHTLVLMSIYPEQVILTNPHGITLAEYPAERITFCGVYADDKKFFGLVTVHGTGDELSEASQDDGDAILNSISSSCHVFMVDPNTVKHTDHLRKAKNFRIDCTPAPEDVAAQCLEFPDSADPILHAIMSLYKNRVGFHLYTRAPGLVDVDAQMSPQHSNTSSNSSNSDSGIGFRDESNGNYQYHHADRVFVVEFDDNQRTRLQNIQYVGNFKSNPEPRSNLENLRSNIDNLRAHMNISLANNINNFASESSDCSLTPAYGRRNNAQNHLGNFYSANNTFKSSDDVFDVTKKPSSSFAVNPNRTFTEERHATDPDNHLRVSVSDKKKLFELRSCLENRIDKNGICDGRRSVTDDLRSLREEKPIVDGRSSVTVELKDSPSQLINKSIRDCVSPPHTGDRLAVRAMPDPITFERSPGSPVELDSPVHVQSIRYSMHKYLQQKQQHLVKVSKRINRRESDNVGGALSVRAFSPYKDAAAKQAENKNKRLPIDLELSQKLSPKVFAFPFKPSAPSERSFTRSLEDLRDSSDGIGTTMLQNGFQSTNFRDGSESDHGLDCFRNLPLTRLMHASESNLSSKCDDSHRGAFRAVTPRSNRYVMPSVVPRVEDLCGDLEKVKGIMQNITYLNGLGIMTQAGLDSCDENTETTENTGGQGGSQDVHPPTQDEFSQDSEYEHVEGEAKKQRGLSLRRLNRTRGSGSEITHSNTDLQKINKDAAPSPMGLSRVTSWAASFEKLLEDPAGLHTFAEFLKKEFSSENIYFWTACERYKYIANDQERKNAAKKIFDRHLGSGAPDPVNIEAQVRPTIEKLHDPDEFLFSAAQKKIYELMKFDSYTRFLKSELYNSCLSHELKGLPLPFPGDDSLDADLRISFQYSPHLKKSKSDADERRRKSLLPWHRKDRSKSKDRGEAEYRRRKKATSDSSSIRSDITDSFTSLNSSDFAGCRAISKESISSCEAAYVNGEGTANLCRVILPDHSNSVLAVKPGQTVKSVIKQLLDRRRVNFSTFNVITTRGEKALELSKDSSILGGLEVRIERMILFSLHLPSRKTVYVKAKPHKLVSEVLKPILSKYGYKLDNMFVYRFSDMNQVSMKGPVSEMDGEKFIAHPKEDSKERTASNNNLDDITNRIFEDLLSGKAHSFDDLGVLDFDARSLKTDISSSSTKCNLNRKENISIDQDNPPLSVGARRRVNSFSKQQEKELYEGLKRAQQSRLDDQRGTEINFELPDFLKSQIPKVGPGRGDFISQEHPEVWGSISEEEENTLLASTDMDETICIEDCTDTQKGKPKKSLPSSPYLTPPPLPPKPKFGGISRGPPPRPPSRHPVDAPVRVTTRNVDKFSVSFV